MEKVDKFLCKAICFGVWRVGFVATFDKKPLSGFNQQYNTHIITKTGVYPVTNINSICGNTGITDKNGNYIFEGDLIKMGKGTGTLNATIVYYNGAYRIMDEFTSNIGNCIPLSEISYERDFEVIGNIHDKEI